MTTKRKYHSKSNSFVAGAEQVCLQPVLEQRRGRGNIAWQAIPQFHTFAPATGKTRSPIVDRRQVGTSSCSVEAVPWGL